MHVTTRGAVTVHRIGIFKRARVWFGVRFFATAFLLDSGNTKRRSFRPVLIDFSDIINLTNKINVNRLHHGL